MAGTEQSTSASGRGTAALQADRRRQAGDGNWPFDSLVDRVGGGSVTGLLLKVALLGAVNGFAVYFTPRLVTEEAWAFLAMMWLATVALDVVYLSRRRLPLKYLLPGTMFLLAFQVYPVIYNTYIAFTNFSNTNRLTASQALEQIQRQRTFTPEDATRYASTPLANDADEVALLLVDPEGNVFLGTAEGVTELPDVTPGALGREVEGYEQLTLGRASQLQEELLDLRIPLESDDGEVQELRLTGGLGTAATQVSLLEYDAQTGELTNRETGVTYRPDQSTGFYRSEEGERLTPGWRVPIGLENFTRVFTSPAIRGPFLRVFVWTYVFALLSVLFSFFLGLILAATLNDPRLRSRKLYQLAMVVPYALPSFLTALIWRGLLNTEFGSVNDVLGLSIPWLTDPDWAKVAVLLVNTWLGFPYMFLICTGALTSIPADLIEAARADGANGFQAFRLVTFPLLLITIAPLLVASFALNFNNFNTIFLLTEGNPPIAGAATPAGHTDILISYTYRLAFAAGSGGDYGFASAISLLIFIMIATITAISFRYTRALEDVT